MLFRLPTWFSGWRDSSKKRIGAGFLALALLLTAITVGTATLVVEMLNARDLDRIDQVGQLQLQQSSSQLELLMNRYSTLLAAFAQDESFSAQAEQAMTTGTSLAGPMKRMISANPAVNHVMLVNPQGVVQASIRRVQGDTLVMGKEGKEGKEDQGHIGQDQDLQDVLSIKPQDLWFSDFVAIKNQASSSSNSLIYGAVTVPDSRGRRLGYLLMGIDVLRFAKNLGNPDPQSQLPQVVMLDAQGRPPKIADTSAHPSLDMLALGLPNDWSKLQTPEQGRGAQGQSWRRINWQGKRTGDFTTVRSPTLALMAWTEPVVLNRILKANAQLVTGIWGSGLALLLLAVGLLFRYAQAMNTYKTREQDISRMVGVGYWRLNTQNYHLELNPVITKSLSIQGPPSHLWEAWLSCFDSDSYRNQLKAAVQEAVKTSERFELEIYMHDRVRGLSGWGRIVGKLNRTSGVWIEGTAQNVTLRKQAEIDAQTFRNHMQNIVNWAQLGVWEYNIPKDERRVNRYLHELLGLSLPMTEEYVKHDWTSKVHPEDLAAMRRARDEYISGAAPTFKTHCRIQHEQGHWVFLVIEGQTVAYDDTGAPTLMRGTALNMTELHQARIDAEEANQAKTRFLSRMSHELRTPLNAIMGYTQLLNLSTHLDAQERDHVNSVLAGSRHLLNLINDLLQITRDDLQNLTLKLQPVNLSELCLRCINLMQPLLVEKQLTLKNLMAAPHWVRADSLRAQQCIINILANAIKYSDAHTTITLEVSTPHAGMVRLSIRDQGRGIAADVGEQVFEPFYRSQDTLNSEEGAGIGLTVSQRLAQQMKGHISYASALGVGTVFHLDLPAATKPIAAKADSTELEGQS